MSSVIVPNDELTHIWDKMTLWSKVYPVLRADYLVYTLEFCKAD